MKKTLIIGLCLCAASNISAQEMKDSVTLKEIIVTAQKPLVKQKDDRIVYDMKNDDESKTNSLRTMLKKVPFLSIDNEGNIQIKGSGNIRIYKDGRPNNSFTKNAKDVLEVLPASLIERVEVISEPGARYDAEGVDGILNIVFKKNTDLNGIMGQLGLQTDNNGEPTGTLYLGSKIGKLDLSLNYTLADIMKSHQKNTTNNEIFYKSTGNLMQIENMQQVKGFFHAVGLEGSYDFNPKNLLAVSLNGYFYDVDIYGDASMLMTNAGKTIYSFKDNYDDSRQSYYNFDGKVDYQHLTDRKGETLTLSYLLSTSDTHQQIGENYHDWVNRPKEYDYDRYFRDNDGKFVEHTFQFDWERPISQQHKLNVGAKYINRNNASEGEQKHDERLVLANDFSHITNVAAAYAEYRYISPKWSLNGGVRYEYAYLKAKFRDGSADDYSRNLNDLVPFLGLTYRLNDANTLKLNYSSRIERPGIDYLNPFRTEDMISISEGNPYLDSSRPNRIALSHTYVSPKLVSSLSFTTSFNNDGIGQVVKDVDNKIYSTYGNIQKFSNYLGNLYLRWQPSSKTNITLNMNCGWTQVKNDDLAMSQNRWNWGGNINFTQDIWWKLKLFLNAGRWEQQLNNVYNYAEPIYWHSISLQRSFLKENRLVAEIGIDNPFEKYQKYKQHTTQGDFTSNLISKSQRRYFMFKLTYRFGSLKSQVKKAAKTITNDDLVGQKKQS